MKKNLCKTFVCLFSICVFSSIVFLAGCGNGSSSTPAPAALAVTTASLPGASMATAYSQTLVASGGKAPYTWALATGSALPAGLTLSTAGVISGTPTTAGTVNFGVTVTDSASPAATATTTLSITVNPLGALAVTTTSLPGAIMGNAYSQALAATGGTIPYTWSLSSGNLPPGLSLNVSTGVISGTPTSVGTSNFTVMVSSPASPTASPATATMALSIAVTAAANQLTITTASPLPVATFTTTAYNQTLAATGGTAPYAWSVSSGALPAGPEFECSDRGHFRNAERRSRPNDRSRDREFHRDGNRYEGSNRHTASHVDRDFRRRYILRQQLCRLPRTTVHRDDKHNPITGIGHFTKCP